MKTSARNRFEGTVRTVRAGGVNDEITLLTVDGVEIVATVTRDSREALGLEPGVPAFGFVKASSIIVVTESEDVRLSARNQLKGEVTRVTPGAVNTEVVMRVAGGATVVAVITNDSATELALGAGMPATAIFKASSVVLGVRNA